MKQIKVIDGITCLMFKHALIGAKNKEDDINFSLYPTIEHLTNLGLQFTDHFVDVNKMV